MRLSTFWKSLKDKVIAIRWKVRNSFCQFYLAERNRFPVYEGSAASGMLGNAASRKIRAPVVNHLFPRLCVNNLVQSRAINKIAREISSTALLAVVVILVPTNGKKGQTKFGRNITYRDPIKDREKFLSRI